MVDIFLKDIQSNIVKSNGRTYSHIFLFSIKKSLKDPYKILELLDPLTSKVKSQYHQSVESSNFKNAIKKNSLEKNKEQHLQPFLESKSYNIAFNYNFYKKLKIKDDHIPEDLSFRAGLNNVCQEQLIGQYEEENRGKEWIYPIRDSNKYDIFYQVSSSSKESLSQEANKIATDISKLSLNTFDQFLYKKKDPKTGKNTEHFGFVDGISEKRNIKNLIKDCITEDLEAGKRGSYISVIKFEQDKIAFEKHVLLLQSEYNRISPNNKISINECKAMIIGRYPDGTPLTPISRVDSLDDIDFSTDPKGEKCPFHSHIRSMNPRTGKDAPKIVRRSLLYSEKEKDGMLFMSYQKNIKKDFLLLFQRAGVKQKDIWANIILSELSDKINSIVSKEEVNLENKLIKLSKLTGINDIKDLFSLYNEALTGIGNNCESNYTPPYTEPSAYSHPIKIGSIEKFYPALDIIKKNMLPSEVNDRNDNSSNKDTLLWSSNSSPTNYKSASFFSQAKDCLEYFISNNGQYKLLFPFPVAGNKVVRYKGGEYFFCPSIDFIQNLKFFIAERQEI